MSIYPDWLMNSGGGGTEVRLLEGYTVDVAHEYAAAQVGRVTVNRISTVSVAAGSLAVTVQQGTVVVDAQHAEGVE